MAARPTVRRRILGMELRKLRDHAGLTTEEVSSNMGWHQSKLSRVENGRSGMRAHEIAKVLDLYGVSSQEEREALGALAREGKQRVWWQPYSDVLTQRYASYIGFEAEAVAMRSFQTLLIPGLLQTPDYARATIQALQPEASAADVRALVEVRLARQNAVLTREEPLKMWAIVDEAVLRRQVGPHEVRERQLLRLAEAAEQPHVVLQVLPFSAGGHIGMLGPFVILEFPVRGDLDVVYAESLTSSLYLERDEDLAAYGRAYDLLRAAALDTGPSRDLIIRIAKGTE
ncbi:helix-turn-helix transcriptional regulator [Streptomyces globisporus]|uniref:helix-turn-helix domain-containing protein n=1 Tax=Streptomyces globisporus TaxID=1908 RepID=UPI00177F7995|nr:helix-turn-helix transcriptional regulator [Streptomyces globisporus]GGW00166.1 transcriptional regulator [Streptomyces globisporus]